MFLRVKGSFVISWIPLTAIDANIITAAPPNTLLGIIETIAASLGKNPQTKRKIPPNKITNLLTIPVKPTRPTFCENEVLGRTPKNDAIVDPTPSHITLPESSLSVASLFSPP